MVSTYERIDDRAMPPRVKVGANYMNSRYGHLEAQALGYDIPIFLDRSGKVSESAGSCLMMVRNGILVTPPTTSSILESITRDTILTIARETDLPLDVRSIDRSELYLADEVFACGTAAEITHIRSVDRFNIGNERPGTITRLLFSRYLAAAESGPGEWLTPVWNTDTEVIRK